MGKVINVQMDEDFYNEIIQGNGGGSVSAVGENDVTFYDYDGTILYSYSKDEFLALTELPPLPSQEGLICQEWNWSLADAKDYVGKYGMQNIGATYITDNGETRIYLNYAESELASITLNIYQSVKNGVTVDWGDGNIQTLPELGNNTISHTYNSDGKYIVRLIPLDCEVYLGHIDEEQFIKNDYAKCSVDKIEIGKCVTKIYSFSYVTAKTINIPNNVIDLIYEPFNECLDLRAMIVPNGVITVGDGYPFYNCKKIKIISFPKTTIDIGYTPFQFCHSLTRLAIPEGITDIEYYFNDSYNLEKVVIPESVIEIGDYAFEACDLKEINIPSSVTYIGKKAFYQNKLKIIDLPDNIETLGSGCLAYTDIVSVVIPKKTTKIPEEAFDYCKFLTNVKLHSNITHIGSSSFIRTNVNVLDFSEFTSVPTLEGSMFGYNPQNKTIIVPDNLYDQWIVDTNWSSLSQFIIKKSDYESLNN